MFRPYRLAQYTLSRFFTTPYAWRTFGKKRVERLRQDSDTMPHEGDIINLDDTHSAHPYAQKLPFLSWLFDSSSNTYSWCMNFVVLQTVLRNGMEYPLFYSVWLKPDGDAPGLSKLDRWGNQGQAQYRLIPENRRTGPTGAVCAGYPAATDPGRLQAPCRRQRSDRCCDRGCLHEDACSDGGSQGTGHMRCGR